MMDEEKIALLNSELKFAIPTLKITDACKIVKPAANPAPMISLPSFLFMAGLAIIANVIEPILPMAMAWSCVVTVTLPEIDIITPTSVIPNGSQIQAKNSIISAG